MKMHHQIDWKLEIYSVLKHKKHPVCLKERVQS